MSVEIGTMIVSSPEIRHGRPRIAGTGLTVHRIAILYNMGDSPEEIVRNYPHLTLAGVHAALAYYHANQAEIGAEIEADEAECFRLEQEFTNARQVA